MYDNIGSKIKTLATAVFLVEAVAAIIWGFILLDAEGIIGILVIIGGPIIAWVSSWILYGFGQLVENSDIMAELYLRENEKHEESITKENERKMHQLKKEAKARIADPAVSDNEFIDITCPNCKESLSYMKAQLQNKEGVVCPVCDMKFFYK